MSKKVYQLRKSACIPFRSTSDILLVKLIGGLKSIPANYTIKNFTVICKRSSYRFGIDLVLHL